MPQQTTMDRVVTLPEDYQKHGGLVPSDAVTTMTPDDEVAIFDAAELEEIPEATIANWLEDQTPITEWVVLRRRKLKVLVRGLTEDERADIEKKAPKKLNRASKRAEPDGDWINMEIVRRSLVKPEIPNPEMLRKALAGELAYLAQKIGEVSGFEMGDALG